ncbi:Ap-1 Complex Subunit Mu-1 [Manis pentadactyla]|nr:Ap-1 Complex Subunit Mu-1 [Manis pentadactyla]
MERDCQLESDSRQRTNHGDTCDGKFRKRSTCLMRSVPPVDHLEMVQSTTSAIPPDQPFLSMFQRLKTHPTLEKWDHMVPRLLLKTVTQKENTTLGSFHFSLSPDADCGIPQFFYYRHQYQKTRFPLSRI